MNFIKILLVLSLSLGNFALFSQGERSIIRGHVADTSGEALGLASVMLLDPSDSTLIEYSQADDQGKFNFKNLERRNYLLKINYVSYIPYQKLIKVADRIHDLGNIQMTPISKELYEVVIKAAKAPMLIKGDTIEYDASTFKVPEGSTVEDLLRKLPGIEVDAQGAITAEGKNVNRVTVDGKNFFGGDPKAATKNLPAEGIAKVQVFSDLTEEQKITGQRRLNSDKAMNLELKEDFKKGGFGKIVAGIGTENTQELKGNYNKFNKKHQFSILGSGTTTGRNGLSWNDYQDFKGSSSFNWGDDGEFGFTTGSNFRFIIFDDSEEDDASGISSFFGSDNYGFPKKISGGVNYNFDNTKTKFSGMYFYDLNNLNSDAYRTQNFLYKDNPYNTLDTAFRSNDKMSHRVELRLEQAIDSFATITVKSNHSLGDRETTITNNQHNINPNSLSKISDQASSSGVQSNTANSQNSVVFRRKFKKNGRNMGLSASYIFNDSERNSDIGANNTFYDLTMVDSTGKLNQHYTTDQIVNTYKANALWSEPLGKRWTWRSFYNYARSTTDYSRLVGDYESNQLVTNNFLSRNFDNTNGYNRLGQGLIYSNEGFTATIAGAYQEILLNSTFSRLDTLPVNSRNVYHHWIPNVELEYELSNGTEATVSYSRSVSAPNSKDLLPIVDNTNPLSIRLGNPELEPRTGHDVSVSFRKFNRLKFTNLFGRIGYIYYDKDIIYATSVDERRVTTSQPVNVNGVSSLNGNVNFGFPVIKNRLTFNLGYNYNYRKDITLVNSIEDHPVSTTNGFSLRSNITPSDNFTLFVNANYRVSQRDSTKNSPVASNLVTYGGSTELNIKLPWLIFFNTSFNLNNYNNKINNFNSTVPILNISVAKLFLKDNKGEIRLSVYDLFNKTVGIQQYIRSNSISQTETLSLARYFMLSFTYNMRGIKSSLDKNNRRGMMFF
ncbi:MAG: TonB-dependent receptor [Saprospiraceae bacterium]